MTPDRFIPLAEQTGLIRPLTLYVLDRALSQVGLWLANGLQLSVAVNLSARNLLDESLPDNIRSLLDKWQLKPNVLELEITESTIMAD
ncbi:MAG: EAL domain-containing protein, partial [Actinomycetota bacterium]